MSFEVDDVRAWLIDLNQIEAAELLSEAEFEFTYIDTAFRLDAQFDETDIMELEIRVPPRVYRCLKDRYRSQVDQIERAISEMSAHTKGSFVRSTGWLMRLPRIEDAESRPCAYDLFADSSLSDVQRLWTKAKSRTMSDPAGAITAARTILEKVCKLMVMDAGGSVGSNDRLPSLYNRAVEQISLSPGKQTKAQYKKLAGSCAAIVDAVACIRNREGDSHSSSLDAGQCQAKFVVNVAGSVALFLLELWKLKAAQQDSEQVE